jgi:hypothetical protein
MPNSLAKLQQSDAAANFHTTASRCVNKLLTSFNWRKKFLSESKNLPNLKIAGATEPPSIHHGRIKDRLLECASRLHDNTPLQQK